MKSRKLTGIIGRVLVVLASLSAWTTSLAVQVPGPLVETDWLAEYEGKVVVLDVRKDASSYLVDPRGSTKKPNLKKLFGHIPGAISIPWKKIVAKGEEQGVELKGMLPKPEAFTQLMQASGVSKNSAVVIAGRGSVAKDQAYATRLYFTLKYFGHDNVALLNGGTAQWAKEGQRLAYTAEKPVIGDFAVVEIRKHLLANTDDVENAIGKNDVQLVDCRTEDFYLGMNYKRKFVSPEHKGHIAGAKSLPFVLAAENWAPAKLFSMDEIRKLAALKGVDLTLPSITYCNTGVVASLTWYVLHELEGNQQTRLYDGSMHAWSTVKPEQSVASLTTMAETDAVHKEPPTGIEGAEQEVALRQPPRSIQSQVEERRDQLRHQRKRYFDTLFGRHFFQPPWVTARGEMIQNYRDRMRELQRQQRDALRLDRDTYRSRYTPDALRFSHGYGPWGPFSY